MHRFQVRSVSGILWVPSPSPVTRSTGYTDTWQTRLHSSRMHTARSLTVSPSMLCSRGVPGPGEVPAWLGGVWSWGGAWSQGGGACLVLGSGIPVCTEADPPLWTESQTPVKILPCSNFVAGGNEPKTRKAVAICIPFGQPLNSDRSHSWGMLNSKRSTNCCFLIMIFFHIIA